MAKKAAQKYEYKIIVGRRMLVPVNNSRNKIKGGIIKKIKGGIIKKAYPKKIGGKGSAGHPVYQNKQLLKKAKTPTKSQLFKKQQTIGQKIEARSRKQYFRAGLRNSSRSRR